MVGQYLPQTNEKCYSVLQRLMWLFLPNFTSSKHSQELILPRRWRRPCWRGRAGRQGTGAVPWWLDLMGWRGRGCRQDGPTCHVSQVFLAALGQNPVQPKLVRPDLFCSWAVHVHLTIGLISGLRGLLEPLVLICFFSFWKGSCEFVSMQLRHDIYLDA